MTARRVFPLSSRVLPGVDLSIVWRPWLRSWMLLLLLAGCFVPAQAQEPAVDTLPRLQNTHEVAGQLDAAYPSELSAVGLGGVVGLRIFVNEEGQADTIHIVSSTGYLSLDLAAISVLSRATYLPAHGAGGARADWLDLAFHFGERDPPLDPPIVVGGRMEALEGGDDNYPRDLRGTGIHVDVPVSIVLDGTGRVETRVLGTDCFPTAAAAAQKLTAMLHYEARTGDPDDVFLSAATVRFAGDSVSFRIRGDTAPAMSRAKPAASPWRRPEVRNANAMQRLNRQNYPPDLLERGIGGTVNLRMFIDADGRVESLGLRQSSGLCDVDLAALAAARIFRFRPAISGGERRRLVQHGSHVRRQPLMWVGSI